MQYKGNHFVKRVLVRQYFKKTIYGYYKNKNTPLCFRETPFYALNYLPHVAAVHLKCGIFVGYLYILH